MEKAHFELEHFAHLARLALDPSEKEGLQQEMDAILGLVGQLAELNLDDVPPTDHVADIVNVYREDAVGTSIARDIALATMPEVEDNHLRVQPMIAGDED